MRLFFRPILAIPLMLIAATAAYVDTFETTRGKPVTFANYRAWSELCGGIDVAVKVSRAPQNGTVKILKGTALIPDRRGYRGQNTSCGGKTVPSKTVIYTPNGGFKGIDRFGIAARMPSEQRWVGQSYRVTVK